MTELVTLELIESDGERQVAVVTLNRPQALNALSKNLIAQLMRTLERCDQDNRIGAIVLTGEGKAFSAGVDLKEVSSDASVLTNDKPMLDLLKSRTTPMLAAINGYVFTGGLELALWCDFMWAADTAVFGDTHALVGLLPTWGMSQKLQRLIGPARASEMSLSGQTIDAQTALQWGLVNRVLPANELLPQCIELAKTIANNDTNAVQGIKQLIDFGCQHTLSQGLEHEYTTSHQHNGRVNFSEMLDRLNLVRKR